MSNLPLRAASYAARPQLLLPAAAMDLARRIAAVDPRVGERRNGPFAFLRRTGLLGRPEPLAMEDDGGDYTPPTRPAAYLPLWLGDADGEGEWGWSLKDGVALLNIDSALSPHGEYFCGAWWHGYDSISAALDEMQADSRVRAIFIRHDSPGGVVSGGLGALAAKLLATRAAAGGKPIHVYADMSASAAYWLAASCDRIIAPRVGIIGSIGCVMTHFDYSKALAADGIAVTPIQFGTMKTDGAPWKPLSPEALAHLQSEVDQIGRDFVAGVVAGRPNLTPEAVLATQAAAYLAHNDDPARSALALGLCDEIATEIQAFTALRDSVSAKPSGQPAGSPAAPAASPTASKENDMKRTAVAAIVSNAALTATAKVSAIAAMIEEEEAAAADPAEEEEETAAADPAAPAGEEDEEEEAPADPMATAQAILNLPEAKGREALARKLAFMPGQTVASAKGLLAAAPRGGTLAERMQGRDPNLSSSGGAADADMGAALLADAQARRAKLAKR